MKTKFHDIWSSKFLWNYRNYVLNKFTYFLIETNCWELQKFTGVNIFHNVDWDFSFFENVETSLFLKMLWQTFEKVETNFWKCWDKLLKMLRQTFENVEIEILDQDHFKTNRDPQSYLKVSKCQKSSTGLVFSGDLSLRLARPPCLLFNYFSCRAKKLKRFPLNNCFIV